VANKKFEGVKELIGLVVVLGTGATLSMAWDAYGGAHAPLRVVARDAGDVWVGRTVDNVFAKPVGSLVAGGFGDYAGKLGLSEVTLRRGNTVIAKTYANLQKGRHPEVVLGTTTVLNPHTNSTNTIFEAGGAVWLLGDQGGAMTWDQAQKACPPGFQLPTALQWQQLTEQFGGCDGCDAITSVDVDTAGDALVIDNDVGFKLGQDTTYWSSTSTPDAISAVAMSTAYTSGGTAMRAKNEYERRDAKMYEKARGTPQTLNEERKARARINEKVEFRYSATASLRLTAHPKTSEARVRCVRG
jgi:uncharacterized protein (TIGR02145 family)